MARRPASPVDQVQPAFLSPGPDTIAAVEQQRPNRIATQTVRAAWIMAKLLELLGHWIEAGNPAAIGRHPDAALPVLGQRPYVVTGQCMRVTPRSPEHPHFIAV